jgi:hypothetical protein
MTGESYSNKILTVNAQNIKHFSGVDSLQKCSLPSLQENGAPSDGQPSRPQQKLIDPLFRCNQDLGVSVGKSAQCVN